MHQVTSTVSKIPPVMITEAVRTGKGMGWKTSKRPRRYEEEEEQCWGGEEEEEEDEVEEFLVEVEEGEETEEYKKTKSQRKSWRIC